MMRSSMTARTPRAQLELESRWIPEGMETEIPTLLNQIVRAIGTTLLQSLPSQHQNQKVREASLYQVSKEELNRAEKEAPIKAAAQAFQTAMGSYVPSSREVENVNGFLGCDAHLPTRALFPSKLPTIYSDNDERIKVLERAIEKLDYAISYLRSGKESPSETTVLTTVLLESYKKHLQETSKLLTKNNEKLSTLIERTEQPLTQQEWLYIAGLVALELLALAVTAALIFLTAASFFTTGGYLIWIDVMALGGCASVGCGIWWVSMKDKRRQAIEREAEREGLMGKKELDLEGPELFKTLGMLNQATRILNNVVVGQPVS